jgi:hypothetical protein
MPHLGPLGRCHLAKVFTRVGSFVPVLSLEPILRSRVTTPRVAQLVFENKNILFYFENAPAYYTAGVVAVNSKAIGLAPGSHEQQKRIRFWQKSHRQIGKFLSLQKNPDPFFCCLFDLGVRSLIVDTIIQNKIELLIGDFVSQDFLEYLSKIQTNLEDELD